jgi:hypothetical protein
MRYSLTPKISPVLRGSLSKAISDEENQNWKTYGRLPDDVRPGRAQGQMDQRMRVASMLAGLNVSPLALQHLLNRD